MKRAGVFVLVVAIGLVGCATHVGRFSRREFDRSDFDKVESGMSRGRVVELLGRPTNVSRSAMHWELGEYREAWVFFNRSGRRVTAKYWQDENRLRLDEIVPLLE